MATRRREPSDTERLAELKRQLRDLPAGVTSITAEDGREVRVDRSALREEIAELERNIRAAQNPDAGPILMFRTSFRGES